VTASVGLCMYMYVCIYVCLCMYVCMYATGIALSERRLKRIGSESTIRCALLSDDRDGRAVCMCVYVRMYVSMYVTDWF
jgi:hypothetical protein